MLENRILNNRGHWIGLYLLPGNIMVHGKKHDRWIVIMQGIMSIRWTFVKNATRHLTKGLHSFYLMIVTRGVRIRSLKVKLRHDE